MRRIAEGNRRRAGGNYWQREGANGGHRERGDGRLGSETLTRGVRDFIFVLFVRRTQIQMDDDHDDCACADANRRSVGHD